MKPVGSVGKCCSLLVAAVLTLVATSAMAQEAAVAPKAPSMRRLTQTQYRNAIADIFGTDITVAGRFDPEVREAGLDEVGAGSVSMTPSAIEQYDKSARSVAVQVVDEKHRGALIGCEPKSATAPDDACTSQFIKRIGPLLYRRPLKDEELSVARTIAHTATETLGSFYDGLAVSLATMLTSPQFLFIQESTEPDPHHPGSYRLDGYAKAARLSLFLWDSVPTADLIERAGHGELNDAKGIARQVDAMMRSRRMEQGIRAFFSDMLQFDDFETLAKDGVLYPKWSSTINRDAQEQTLRTIVDQLLIRNGDYRDLFTSQKTFLTAPLAAVYRVALPPPQNARDPQMPYEYDAWAPYEFGADRPQAGILTHISFVGLHGQPGRSSPTVRGKALREILLCQKVPPPPGNVDFKFVQDTTNPEFRTVRQRLAAHASNPVCAGCHKLTDPIGLAMENFDTIGGYRTEENGRAIDASGELNGVKFTDVAGLARVIHDSPALTSCVVDRLYAYGLGHALGPEDSPTTGELKKSFAKQGYRVTDLIRTIATSDAFFNAAAPMAASIRTAQVAQ